MNRELIRSGARYRRHGGALYQVITIALCEETGEMLVIYQALYGEFQVYAKEAGKFLSDMKPEEESEKKQTFSMESFSEQRKEKPETDFAEKKEQGERRSKTTEEKLAEFFDTEDLETRYNILVSLKGELNDLMINNLAVVLDVVIPDGSVESRYEELKRCIRTKQKYENSRLR